MKSIELAIKIGARVSEMVKGMQTATNSVTKVNDTINKLNSKKIDIVANDSSVLKVKNSIEDVENKIDALKNKKAEIALRLDKGKEDELNNSIFKINNKIDKLKDKEELIQLKIKATTDEKELKKLNRELDKTQSQIVELSEEKLELKEEFDEVREANKKVNAEIRETNDEIRKLNSKKIELKDELKETERQSYETNSAIEKIDKTVKKINGTQLKIKQTVEKREILKTEIMGNVQKVAAMGVGLGSVAYGINRINQETVKMANLADTVGLSFENVNTLGSAVKGIGLDYEHVTDIMEELNNKIGESKVVYQNWLKEDKGKGKKLKLVGGVDDAFKGLDFSLSDKNFKGLDYEETFKKFTNLKGDKQFEIVMDTALKMKDEQKAASMVDILMGGEANKILSFLRKQGLSYKEFIEQKKKLVFLDEEGLKGAKAYAKVSAKTSSIVGSIFQQISGIGGGYMSPILDRFNKWLIINKQIVKSNIKGFFEGLKSSMQTTGAVIDSVTSTLRPLTNLFGITSDQLETAGESGERWGKALGYVGAGVAGIVALKLATGTARLATNYATGAVNILRLSYLKLNGAMLASRGATIAQTLTLTNLGKVAKATSRILLRSPWGLAIAGLALGALWVRKNWEPIKGFFVGLSQEIGDALQTIKTVFGTVFGAMEHYIRPIISALEPVGEVFRVVFGTALGYIGAGVGGVLALKMAFAVLAPAIGAVGTALAFVGRALLMNPIGLAVTAIAGTAYILYEYWEPISGFFGSLWGGIKSVFDWAWSGIKTLFDWSPLGVVINNWQPMLSFFTAIGDGVKNLFLVGWNGLKSALAWNPLDFVVEKWNHLTNFFSNFSLKDAGSKIISSVIDGMSATWQKLTKKVGDITKSIRDFFPFSPAKTGALTDIHKVKLMETVANGLNEKPLLKAVSNTTGKVRKALALTGSGVALSSTLAVAEPVIPDAKETEKSAVFQKVLETKENLLPSSLSLPALQDRTFNTLENLQPANMGNIVDRTFQTKELYSPANIPSVPNREFLTQESLITKSLPALQDRTFNTLENLQPANMGNIVDRTFQTKELYSPANIPSVPNREFLTQESLITKSLPALQDRTFNTLENLQPANMGNIVDRTFQTKELYSPANIPSVPNREFLTQESLITKSLPALQDRSFETKENLKLNNINPVEDRTFQTNEILSPANIPSVFNREFLTKENLLTSSLPAVNNRSFNTLENLKLNNIAPISDRTFETKEVFAAANIPSLENKIEEMEPPKPFTVSEQDKTAKEEAAVVHHHNNNSQIHVNIGDIIVQASLEGGVANPEILKGEIMEMLEDGIRQAQNNTQDTQFSDIGGLG